MENRLLLALMPSLEQMALRRVAAALYSDPRVLDSIANFRVRPGIDCGNIWDTGEGIGLKVSGDTYWRRAVIDAVSELQLPESLRNQMMPTVRAVGLEIFTWKSFHAEYFGSCTDVQVACLQRLCWTRAGAVDYRRTAERLVRFSALDVEARFRLACLYCLQDSLQLLWEKLSDQGKRNFWREEVIPTKAPNLQLLLPRILEKQTEIWWYDSRNFFEESALWGYKTLAEFCFGNLTREERGDSLIQTAKNVICSRDDGHYSNKCDIRRGRLTGVLCYLLSLMTTEEQVGIFREMPCEVLRCFLDWPWQDLFPYIADVIWTFLPEEEYATLMDTIQQSMDCLGYYFPNVLQNFFLRSPREFRKCFVAEEIRRGGFFWTFFAQEDTETIRVIVRSLDPADRVKLVFSDNGFDLIYLCLYQWHVKEAFLRAAALSEADKRKLKEHFVAQLERNGRIHLARDAHGRIHLAREAHGWFFEFMEGIGTSAAEPERQAHGKRTKTEHSSVKAKKIRFNN